MNRLPTEFFTASDGTRIYVLYYPDISGYYARVHYVTVKTLCYMQDEVLWQRIK